MNTDTVQIFVMNGATTTNNLDKIELKCGDDVQVNHENPEDITNICRICATVTDLVIPIFNGEGLQNKLADKIHEHLPIKVSEKDMLPRVVCYQCSSTLLAWHELVQCCRQADQAFRQRAASSRLNTGKKTNEDISIPESKTDPKLQGAARERACRYCDTECPDDVFLREHLKTVHGDDFFGYQECEDRDDGEDTVAHVTLPAFEHGKIKEKKTRKYIRNCLNSGSSKNLRCKSTRCNASEPTAANDVETEVDRDVDVPQGVEAHCEFSEQSNVEDFGPLPESVFEAIEDSQEYQEIEHNINENETVTNDNIELEVNDHRDPSPTEEASESHRSESATTNGANAKGSKTRKCPKCDKVYTASSSYFYHLKYSHNQTKEHECEVCGKKFGTKASLSAHGTIHTGDRRYACKECGKTFRTGASLYIHEQTHSGVKSHSCSECERSFRWRTHLQRHERRHRGERPHACSTCARAFSVRADLLRHARTHAAGAHACDRCGDTFAQPRYLRVHVINKHSDVSHARKNC